MRIFLKTHLFIVFYVFFKSILHQILSENTLFAILPLFFFFIGLYFIETTDRKKNNHKLYHKALGALCSKETRFIRFSMVLSRVYRAV